MTWLRKKADYPVAYHGTTAEPFVVFEYTDDIGFHFGAVPDVADARLQSDRVVGPGESPYPEGARIMPVRLLIKNPLRLPDLHTWEPKRVLLALRDAGVLSTEQVEEALDLDELVDQGFVREALEAKGYDSIIYRNETEYLGGEENKADSYIVFRPEQVKSVFNASPNPESADITAARKVDWDQVLVIAEQVRGGAMSGHYDEPADWAAAGISSPRDYSGDKAYPEDPSTRSGGCDQMSELLCDTLDALGYRARTVDGRFMGEWPHTWVELEGRVLDLTADQFNDLLAARGLPPMPKVYVSDGPDPRYEER